MFGIKIACAGCRSPLPTLIELAVQGRTRRLQTTVDQTLMRGLGTAGPWFVLGLPPSQLARARGSPNHIEGCPDRPPRPTLHSITGVPSGFVNDLQSVGAGAGTLMAIAQAKAASSRAMATVTMFFGRPARCMRL